MTAKLTLPPPGADGVLDDSNWSHKAWMSQVDADLFEQIVLRLSRRAAPRFDALEWGTGRSTFYFTGLLAEQAVPFNWLTLEYDRGYFEREVRPTLAGRPGTRLLFAETDQAQTVPDAGGAVDLEAVVFDKGKLSPFLAGNLADRQANLDDYVAYPRTLGRKFDLIFVDGRKRRRCLIEAAALLKDGGVALLHDAYRPYYHCAFDHFKSWREIGEILRIGSQADTDFQDLLA